MKNVRIFSLAIVLLFAYSCNTPVGNESEYSGHASFYAEKNIQPYIETTLVAYSGFAPKESYTPIFKREIDVVNIFLADKSNLVFMSRDLDKSEKAFFKKQKQTIRTEKIMLGAIALISPMGEDSTYTENEFMELLVTNDENSPKILFDDVQSANFNYFYDKLKKQGKKFGKHVKCLHSNTEVINYMKDHKQCIGVIGYNWISDIDDKEVLKSMENVQLVRVSKGNSSNYVIPTMYYVYEKQYPFTHFWYAHYHGGQKALEAGLLNYIIDEKGQLIAKKSGLQPYYRVSREFKFVFE